ncbi:MAG TPA: acyl-CoA dehydrogenase family protein [Mycobacterium sp.]|nr:acyl-CoA dehydrogenase family protein [Mycobacterium sp.]
MSDKAADYHKRLSAFMTQHVFRAEAEYDYYRQVAGPHDHTVPPIIEELKAKAKERGLWNLFLPAESGLTNLEYAPLAEQTGWSMEIAPEALNCAAPDTGNMEILHMFATEEQRKQWLQPLLDGQIRSGFSMTEPAVASSDARNIETTITRDGGDYVINGHKWWTSGAADPRCKILIVMGRTNPDAAAYQQQSMILVPIDTPGVTIVRSTPVFGWQDQHGHSEVIYDNVRVLASNLLGEEGAGFAIAQARLGPGRIHHCMRALGAAERALALMVDRARNRVTFGRPLAEQGVVQQAIAKSRNEIDQARLLCEKAAWTIDRHGNKEARHLVAQIKAVAPQVACDVIDRAIQVYGAAGVSDDTPLARLYGWHRAMRIFDGPDEVHLRSIARAEIRREKSAFAAAVT